MADFVDWLRENLWAGWGITALALAGAELLTLDLTLLMLAAGAAAGGVTALIFPGLFWLQLLVAALTAVATLFLLRPTLLERVRNAPGYRSSLDTLVGTAGVATTEITGITGEVKVDGQVWQARSFDADIVIHAGEAIEVYGLDGVTLTVYPTQHQIGQ